MKVLVPLLAFTLLAGCAGPQVVTIDAEFDSTGAAALLQPGSNTITGSALIRQSGGGIVTCAGNPVHLIPATNYAAKRVNWIYGTANFSPFPTHITFQPEVPAYQQQTRQATCNAQGFFRFDKVADGDFFVQSTVVWKVGQYQTIQGGGLIRRVSVKDGQTADITLSP
jgi:hypothetical protein